jgi:hypothetical protein
MHEASQLPGYFRKTPFDSTLARRSSALDSSSSGGTDGTPRSPASDDFARCASAGSYSVVPGRVCVSNFPADCPPDTLTKALSTA